MTKASEALAPAEILDAFEESGGGTHVSELEDLYGRVGKETATLLALGAAYLAQLWEGAWKAGGGPSTPAGQLGALDPNAVRSRYVKKDFVPSLTLDRIKDVLEAP